MKISMVRRTDGLGRVALPEELRSALGLEEGASVRLTLEGRRVMLERKRPSAPCAVPPKTCVYRGKRVLRAVHPVDRGTAPF